MFLFGIAVSAVTSLVLRRLLTGAWPPTASHAADVRRVVSRLHRGMAFTDRERDTKLEHQERADHMKGTQ